MRTRARRSDLAAPALDAVALCRTLSRYWFTLFPIARKELSRIRARAEAIPDTAVREHALTTLRKEKQNAESAAAFAVLAAPRHRRTAARLLVAYQAMYDFLDTLTELPSTSMLNDSRQLHTALIGALGAPRPPNGYYPQEGADDDGYLDELVSVCARRFWTLPSANETLGPLHAAAGRTSEGQSQNHAALFTNQIGLMEWATTATPPGTGLQWWETAAGGGSTLSIHALLGAAGDPSITARDADQIHRAYWPWVNALNTLLESVVDIDEDIVTGNHNYASHYRNADEMERRLGLIASQAAAATQGLHRHRSHRVIVAAMASYYLAQTSPASPAGDATERVRSAFGAITVPLLAMLRLRRRLLD